MIKKILSTLLVSSAFLVFAATGTMADSPTFAIGYTAAYGGYEADGIMDMDVETKESLHTDSQYPNASMDGETYGFGWKGLFDNGVFIKTETMMQDWSDLHLEGTGMTTTDNNTSIDAKLAGAVATISIGRAF